jgi:Secretion system C-terminal sorting domain
MQKIYTFFLVFFTNMLIVNAQTFNDNYSSNAGWTHQSAGNTIDVQNGTMNYTQNYCGGTDEYNYKPLGFTLDNSKWTMDFEWTGTAGSNVGVSALIASLTSTSADPAYTTSDTSTSVTNNNTISVLYFSCYGCGSAGNGIEIITKRGTSQYVWHNALRIPLPFNETGYIRLERLSANTGMISVFADAARTQHRAGSPRCFPINPAITDLKYLQHGTWVPGSGARYTSGYLDNTVVENNVNHSTPNIATSIIGNSFICASGSTTLSTPQNMGYNAFAWSNGSTTASITAAQAGIYTVTATASNLMCMATASVSVVDAPSLPNLQFTVTPAVCSGNMSYGNINVTNPPANTTYQWSTWQAGTAIYANVGVYNVTVTNEYNCTLVQSILVPCETGTVIGSVFSDDNQNGAQDAGEVNIPYIQLSTGSGNNATYAASHINGKYYLGVEGIGSHNIGVDNTNGGTITTTLPIANTVSTSDIDSTDNNIGIYYPNGVRDLSVYVNNPIVRPGFNFTANITYSNRLNTTVNNAVVSLEITDINPSFVSATPAPSSINGNIYTWNVGTVAAFTDHFITLTLNTPASVPIGSDFNLLANITPLFGDINVANNTYVQKCLVRGSYDPNDKLVSPETFNGLATIPDLDYTIRFQNTGTDTAFTVIVRDTLSNLVDISTLRFLGSSHLCTYKVNANRELVFTFNNILLLDKTTNEPKSHGFVSYRITPKANARQAAGIQNTANIYFDFNTPIRTNTANTRVYLASENVESTENHALNIAPNPANTTARISTDLTDFTLTITDLSGRIILVKTNIPQNNVDISVADFATGQYFITLQSKEGRITKKMIVTR